MPSSRRGSTGQGPVISVQKIPLEPLPPPVETHGKPVTGLEKVRLRHNLIVADGEKSRLIPRGEIVDINIVAERWRTDEYIEPVDEYRRDKVMMLHDFTCAVPTFDGERTVYREKLFSAYSLVDLASIPNRVVEGLVEGRDYASQWDEADRKVKELERHYATEEFSMDDPVIPDDVSEGKDVHNRYGSL